MAPTAARLWPPISPRCRSRVGSSRSSICSGAARRSFWGMCENSAWTEGAPMTRSMRATSSSVWGMYLMLLPVFAKVVFVLLRGHQLVQLARRGHLDLDHPAFVVAVLVEDLRAVYQRVVDLGHLAADRRVDVRDRLDRFDRGDDLSLADGLALLGQVDLGDVAELLDCELGDAHGGEFAILALWAGPL